MTVEQAIGLENKRLFANADETINTISTYAMQKQIPKAIQLMNNRTTENEFFRWVCPNCGAVRHTRVRVNYCSYCGQRIDWRGYLQTARELSISRVTDEEIEREGDVFPELKQEVGE